MTISSAPPYDISTKFDTNHDTGANDRPRSVARNAGRGTPFVGIDSFGLDTKNLGGRRVEN